MANTKDPFFKKGNKHATKRRLGMGMRNVIKLNREEFETKLHSYLGKSMDDVINILETKTESCIDGLVASVIIKAIQEGCITRLNFILKRIGIHPEQVVEDYGLSVKTVDQEAPKDVSAPFYVVEINNDGKFLRARPRELLLAESEKIANG